MALACPRCQVPMRAITVRPRGAPHAVTVDRCDGCDGLWLDRGEAEAVCPTVAYLERRHVEIVTLGAEGAGIARCPRCGVTPYEFRLLELGIDYCPGCAGVWLDGHEAAGRVNLEDAPGQAAPSPYRAIERAARVGEALCLGCGEREQVRAMYMAAEGLVCRSCYLAAVAKVQERRARNERGVERPPTAGSLLGELVAAFLSGMAAG